MSDNSVPCHVAIIMDGNGRWARARNMPELNGHKSGAEVLSNIVNKASSMGVQYLTVYAFSSENWKRQKSWIDDFFGLTRFYLKNEISSLIKSDVRVKFIGNTETFPEDIKCLIIEAEKKSTANTGLNLNVAFGYGARQEICEAIKSISRKVQSGIISPDEISDEVIKGHLYTKFIPDPDLLIRTSGEQRVSNYLLWQIAYTEFLFVDKLWPEFTADDFEQAINDYKGRNRRYGK